MRQTSGLPSHDIFSRIATIDLPDNILVKERVEIMLKATTRRSSSLESIFADASK